MITIVEEWMSEEWMVVDKSWEPIPERTYYREVIWNGSVFMFKQALPDKVWRIVSATRTPTTSTRGSYPAE